MIKSNSICKRQKIIFFPFDFLHFGYTTTIRNENNGKIKILKNSKETGDRIPTNLRRLIILEVLGQSDRAMTETGINESLDSPK